MTKSALESSYVRCTIQIDTFTFFTFNAVNAPLVYKDVNCDKYNRLTLYENLSLCNIKMYILSDLITLLLKQKHETFVNCTTTTLPASWVKKSWVTGQKVTIF